MTERMLHVCRVDRVAQGAPAFSGTRTDSGFAGEPFTDDSREYVFVTRR